MATLRIEVTLEDIMNGCRNSSLSCPVAYALRRATNLPALVHDDTWTVHDSSEGPYPLPEVAATFISRFDRGRFVAPVAFDLEVP